MPILKRARNSRASASKPLRWLIAAFLVCALGFGLWLGRDREPSVLPEGLDIARLLQAGAEDEGFQRPDGDWSFSFPADHGAHPGFRSELWSIKGHLRERDDGRAIGFQLVFLRLALKPGSPQRDSAWAAYQVYAAHLALTDPSDEAFDSEERISRGALGLAGSGDERAQVWVEDWSLMADANGKLELRASMDEDSLTLDLEPVKPMLRQGELDLGGLGGGAGGGVHFYLMPRLALSGIVEREGGARQVTGFAWLDHAWGDVPVPRGQVALDRFSLQLDDGRDLLCLRLRRRDGSGTPVPSCLTIDADGAVDSLRRRDISLEPIRWWESPVDGARYPIGWSLRVRRMGLEIALRPLAEDQELTQPMQVWSGAVTLEGKDRSGPLTGWGFVELTGYGKVDQTLD